VHSVAPGVQLPWHDAVLPLATHAWLVHGTAVPQVPPVLQVCTAALPEHCDDPGEQFPVHAPPEQVALPQSTGAPHVPVELQVSTPLLLVPPHWVCPGAHEPVQEPPTQAVLTHVEGAPQCPVESQVEKALSEPPSAPVAHSVAPGEHCPWHEPDPTGPTHAWSVQGVAIPQVPFAVHVW